VNDVTYWREQAEMYKRNWEEEQEELKEFQLSSKELEAELEAQLEASEAANIKLKAQLERMFIESENQNERYETASGSLNQQVTSMQEELTSLRLEKVHTQQYIRKMEQTNDDLERSKRSALASVEDFENRLNQLLERNALLEVELDEKEELTVDVQRLKDEVRDLNQELVVRRPPDLVESSTPDKDVLVCDEAMRSDTLEACTQTTTPSTIATAPSRTLTPSARIAALNLVSDLLQKVALLEANLAHVCQCYDVTPAKLLKMGGTTTVPSANGI